MGLANENAGFTLWLTGMRGAGKSTLAGFLGQRLRSIGRLVEVLDENDPENSFGPAMLDGSAEGKPARLAHARRLGYLARLLTRNNVIAILASLSPDREARSQNRREIGRFVEVFVDCAVDELIRRDEDGLYAKALAGELKNFTGITAPYEPPTNAEITVRTHEETVEASARRVFQALLDLGYLRPVEATSLLGQKARRRPPPAKAKRPGRPARAHRDAPRRERTVRKAARAAASARRARR